MKQIVGLVLFVSLVLSGCSANNPVVEPGEGPVDKALTEYRAGVADVLSVSVWRNEELSVTVPVRPDGKISVPLIGDVNAAGKTVEEISDDIEGSLKSYIRTPKVTVIVAQINSTISDIRITGAVNAPQTVPHLQGITVLDVVLRAGSLTPFANPNSAKLYRKNDDGEMQVYAIKLRDILEKGRLETNYELQPSDIITVPERAF